MGEILPTSMKIRLRTTKSDPVKRTTSPWGGREKGSVETDSPYQWFHDL